jgi:hypothetical protein
MGIIHDIYFMSTTEYPKEAGFHWLEMQDIGVVFRQ